MKFLKNALLFSVLITILVTCSSAQNHQVEAPVEFGKAYYQNWIGGIEGAGSGLLIFIPIEKKLVESIKMDSVYFRGKGVKLVKSQDNPLLFVGRFSLVSFVS